MSSLQPHFLISKVHQYNFDFTVSYEKNSALVKEAETESLVEQC